MPKVSWLVPVYNAEPYLEMALKSIADQTYRSFEAIVVDDGSSDGSSETIQAMCARDARFRHIRKSNSGIVDTLNLGLEHCQGEYLARMDGDDICEPNRLEQQLAYMEAHPECVVAGTRVMVIDSSGNVIRYSNSRNLKPFGPNGFPPGGITLTHPTIIGRTAAFRQVGGYRNGFLAAEDYDLWFRLRRLGKIVELPEYLLRYRVHAKSESALKIGQQRFSSLKSEVVTYLTEADVSAEAIQPVLDCTSADMLIQRAALIGRGLPDADMLRTYYLSEYLRRATYRLSAAEARKIAADTFISNLKLLPKFRSPSARYFFYSTVKELMRWAAVTLTKRNRDKRGRE